MTPDPVFDWDWIGNLFIFVGQWSPHISHVLGFSEFDVNYGTVG
jgi:hypothetical protein